MDSFDKFNETKLPPISAFHNDLTNRPLSVEDYDHANNVWKHFKICNLGEYTDLYLKSDVMLLTDVFENFREMCIHTYGLDPSHYVSTPGYTWDAMLKYTEVELELLSDPDMLHFVKNGIRGGVSQCSNRYGIANNKYMNDKFDATKESNFLIYIDANNLYGWAMMQHLPISNFQWMQQDDINKLNWLSISETSDIGYILEVDLEYPTYLHDEHNDFPFCPESFVPPHSKNSKLIVNLHNKTKYAIHYRNLQMVLKGGLKLQKIHRVLQFHQTNWLKKYVDLNTELRKSAQTDFEKNLFKMMVNAVYGKTMENVEKRVNIRLVTKWENDINRLGAQTYVAKPNYHSSVIVNENFAIFQMNPVQIKYLKPIYLGFCVLDLSKTLMYDFHYNFMKPRYQDKCKLLYTDTDSFIYDIKTEDYYDDMRNDLVHKFDTSGYDPKNPYQYPLINKKVIGLMKDELNGTLLLEFVGLRAKMYAIRDNSDNSQVKKMAKGVNKSAVEKLSLEDYKKYVENCNAEPKRMEMRRFRSIKHVVQTQLINKIALSGNDDKRYLQNHTTDTLAWGHYKI